VGIKSENNIIIKQNKTIPIIKEDPKSLKPNLEEFIDFSKITEISQLFDKRGEEMGDDWMLLVIKHINNLFAYTKKISPQKNKEADSWQVEYSIGFDTEDNKYTLYIRKRTKKAPYENLNTEDYDISLLKKDYRTVEGKRLVGSVNILSSYRPKEKDSLKVYYKFFDKDWSGKPEKLVSNIIKTFLVSITESKK